MRKTVIFVGICTVCILMTACWGLRNSEKHDSEKLFSSKKAKKYQKEKINIFITPEPKKYLNPEEEFPKLPEPSEDSNDQSENNSGWFWE